jgi:hypothetical protein
MRLAKRSSNGSFEVGFGRWLFEVKRIYPYRYEVQDTDERGHLIWYSGEGKHHLDGQMSKERAIGVAQSRQLSRGHKRIVRHVGTNKVVYEVQG